MFTKLKEYGFLFSELVKRDFKKKYKRTYLGMLWSLLSPLLNLFVMRIVFTNFFGTTIAHYTTFLFCGNIVFAFFSDATGGGMGSLLDNAEIFRSAPIAPGGEFLSPDNMLDGSQTYLGGMAYYYGVGNAGLSKKHPAPTFTDCIFLARFDGENRVLECYHSADGGESYQPVQTIRSIPKESEIKIWRPIVPIYAQDNMPLYWHEGLYGAHTGGWHCDMVAYVEYDD